MLTKNAVIKIKAGPDDGLDEGAFTAYASVFHVKDSYGDVVMPGAFSKSLAQWQERGHPIPLLFGHQMDDPDMNLGHVVAAKEDDHGLHVHAQLDLDNPKSVQVYRMLKGRRINQMSFAYDVIDGGPEKRSKAPEDEEEDDGEAAKEVFALRELKLYEVSIVTVGANEDTEILAVKQATTAAKHSLALVKSGRVLSAKNETELRAAHEALTRVLSALDGTPDEEKASGTGPSRQAPPAVVSRGASRNPSVAPSAITRLGTDLDLSA